MTRARLLGSMLVALLAGCSSGGGSGGGDGGGGGGGSSSGGHSFACGDTTCNSATQYCYAVVGGVQIPDASSGPAGSCEPQDGGQSCTGGSATAPGQCGCYESTSGEITITLCAP